MRSSTRPESEQSDRRPRLVGLAVSLIVVVAAVFLVVLLLARRPETAPIEILPPAPTDTPAPWRVYVTGAVLYPGVVELDPQGRVEDAIEAAGGATSEADLERLNMAAPLSDGQHLRVPAVGEELPAVTIDERFGGAVGRININTATAAELDALPGVGEATAAKIIEHRQAYGPFETIEAIMDVPGIGEAKFEAMRELITVGP